MMDYLTPLHIELLIFSAVHEDDDKHPRIDNKTVKSFFMDLVSEGLLKQTIENSFTCTSKGRAHISQLCNVPLPRTEWIGFDGKIITDI